MERIESPAGLDAFRKSIVTRADRSAPVIVIPAGTCGRAAGAHALVERARQEIQSSDLAQKIRLRVTGCHGFCEMEPSLLIKPADTFYPKVSADDMPRIIQSALTGNVLHDLLYTDTDNGSTIEKQGDIPFFQKQRREILGRNECVDPTSIEDYVCINGYAPLAYALDRETPQSILQEIKDSGLRGRGGGGFPTGLKWEMLAQQPDRAGRVLICNADEGDPGAYMDRAVLEGNPHSIIEGMLIGAYATGATEGVIYVRGEYPLAVKNLHIALEQAREIGLLGKGILGKEFSFDIRLVRGAGAFVCGEETALIRSIEGKTGEPRQRPPYPVQRGVEGKPTAINNVETWVNIPIIIERGSAVFKKTGRENNSGTKIFSLVGKVRNTGLVEVPMGITLDEIIMDIGGGPSGKTKIKAVQTGGPSGGCIPAEMFDCTIDYDSLKQVGAIMGSGGMIVMDEGTCMVDVAKYFMNFLKDESCGKCFTCRKGTQRMYEILDDISRGIGTIDQLALLQELAEAVKDTTLCGLGQTAPNPVLSTLRHFREEYIEHIQNSRCPAGVCKELITYTINQECVGCGRCAEVCPVGAISGKRKEQHSIDAEKCVKCGACSEICSFNAIDVR